MIKLLPLILLLACAHKKEITSPVPETTNWSMPQTWDILEKNDSRIFIIATYGLYGNSDSAKNLPNFLEILSKTSGATLLHFDIGGWRENINKNQGNILTTTYALGISSEDLIQNDLESDLKSLSHDVSSPMLTTNLIYLKTAQTPSWKNIENSKIIDLKNIKVGVISLLPSKKMQEKPSSYLQGFYLEPSILSIIREGRNLRNRGADMIIVLASDAEDVLPISSKIPSGLIDLVITNETTIKSQTDFQILDLKKSSTKFSIWEVEFDLSKKYPQKTKEKKHKNSIDTLSTSFLGQTISK